MNIPRNYTLLPDTFERNIITVNSMNINNNNKKSQLKRNNTLTKFQDVSRISN